MKSIFSKGTLTLAALTVISGGIFAQKKLPGLSEAVKIAVLASPSKDSIVLRWAPSNEQLWAAEITGGVYITRYTLSKKGIFQPDAKKLGTVLNGGKPVMPLEDEAWAKLIQKNAKAEVVQDYIYGKHPRPKTPDKGIAGFLASSHESQARFGFTLLLCDLYPELARAAGLLFTDRTVSKDEKYIYQITLATSPKLSYEKGVVVTSPAETFGLSPVKDLQVSFLEKKAVITWPGTLYSGMYTAYDIERSEDGKKFMPVTELPFVQTQASRLVKEYHYEDSVKEFHRTFYYRIRGISPFGEHGPYSNIAQGEAKETSTDLPVITAATVITNKTIELKWEIPEALLAETRQITVLRASKDEGPYVPITKELPREARQFTDNAPKSINYYRIEVFNDLKASKRSFSRLAQLEDNTPPLAPLAVIGTVDSAGYVRLHWTPNSEPDLLGYRVFRANTASQEFTEVSRFILAKAFFKDTIDLKTLSRKICYRIVAVDKNYNVSAYSAITTLTRPDRVPPIPAQFEKAGARNDTASLSWRPSPSKDVAAYELYRVNTDSLKRELVVRWNAKADSTRNKQQDVPVTTGAYQYILKTTDSAGNISEARTVSLYVSKSQRSASISIKLKADRVKREITLRWKNQAEVQYYFLYRATNDQPLILYQRLKNDDTWTDKELSPNNTYRYKLRPYFKDGRAGGLSSAFEIMY